MKDMKDNTTNEVADVIDHSNKNTQYDYVLRYIQEGIGALAPLLVLSERAIKAYQGEASRNRYNERIDSYVSGLDMESEEEKQAFAEVCKSRAPRKNTVIKEAIETMVGQAAGGAERFEPAPYDETKVFSREELADLAAAMRQDWIDNGMDALVPKIIRSAALKGGCHLYPVWDKKRHGFTITMIPNSDMLIDPMLAKVNKPRFIGHRQANVSWLEFKNKITKKKDGAALKSINMVDTYLREVEHYVNKDNGQFSGSYEAGKEYIANDANLFYRSSALEWQKRHKDQMGAKDVEPYRAGDVEVSYLYDLGEKKRFTVINRRFIVEVESNPYSKKIDIDIELPDEESVTVEKTVRIDHPYIPIYYEWHEWNNFPSSPLWQVLDDFDELCALETLLHEIIMITTPVNFTGNPLDIEAFVRKAGINGAAIETMTSESMSIIDKRVDVQPLIALIDRLEQRIRRVMNGQDAAQMSQMIGDRASAKEITAIQQAVMIGLNPFIAIQEAAYAELGTKLMKLRAIYSGEEFSFSVNGQYGLIGLDVMAADFNVRCVMRARTQMEQQRKTELMLQAAPMILETSLNKKAAAKSIISSMFNWIPESQIEEWYTMGEEEQLQMQQNIAQSELEQAQLAAQAPAGPVDPSQVNPYGMNNQFTDQQLDTAFPSSQAHIYDKEQGRAPLGENQYEFSSPIQDPELAGEMSNNPEASESV